MDFVFVLLDFVLVGENLFEKLLFNFVLFFPLDLMIVRLDFLNVAVNLRMFRSV